MYYVLSILLQAEGGGKLPSDWFDLVWRYGFPIVISVLFLWGYLIKSPPLFVSFREFKLLYEEKDKLLKQVEDLNRQLSEATKLAATALEVHKKEEKRQKREDFSGTSTAQEAHHDDD